MTNNNNPVHVIGASGRCGQAVCRALIKRGTPVIALVRNKEKLREKLQASGLQASGSLDSSTIPLVTSHVIDMTGPKEALQAALDGATRIVCTAHARHIPALLAAAPKQARLVCLGSTRKFTQWPDEHARGVLQGERALLESGRAGVILHPSMIYGAAGENNVQRLAALLRFLPVVPLPEGGKSLVQPIYQDDVTACILAALEERLLSLPCAIVIAGAQAVPYRVFVAEVARAAGLKPKRIVTLPVRALQNIARLTAYVPKNLFKVPTIHPDEIRRLTEDKAFDNTDMRTSLGVSPLGLKDGLARTFHNPYLS